MTMANIKTAKGIPRPIPTLAGIPNRGEVSLALADEALDVLACTDRRLDEGEAPDLVVVGRCVLKLLEAVAVIDPGCGAVALATACDVAATAGIKGPVTGGANGSKGILLYATAGTL